MKVIIFLLMLMTSSSAFSYESTYPPIYGGNIYLIKYKFDKYTFCQHPKTDASCVKKNVTKGALIKQDPSKGIRSHRVITIQKVEMIAKNNFDLSAETLNYTYKNIHVEKGQIITAYQARSYAPNSEKDNYIVEINGTVLTNVYIKSYTNHLSNIDQKPIIEWWIEIAEKGWLLIENDNVILGFASGAG